MRIYVIRCGAKGTPAYLASIEDGNIATWRDDGYGNKIRSVRKNTRKQDGETVVRTAIYKEDIEEAMTFEGIAAAREFIAKEPVLRFCVPALKSREAAKA